MTTPTSERIPRTGRGTTPDDQMTDGIGDPLAWAGIEQLLLDGPGTTWLSTGSPRGVHTRPLFAAWTGASFVFASKAGAAKTRHLEADGRVSLALDLGDVHLVVEGTASRLVGRADLERASRAMEDVYDWPTTIVGDELDAPYAAPTSGGPPFRAYEVTPSRAWAFPTRDQAEPARFTW